MTLDCSSGTDMAIEKQLCPNCGVRHNLNEPHVLSGGKKTARKRRAGKVTATVVENGGDMTAVTISERDWIVNIDGCQCGKCGHTWVPISERKPKRCPSCMSRAWSA